jgi:SNF2 family DNA or RNA helicase
MGKEFFGLGLFEHRLWGFIFIPYMISKSSEGKFYTPSHTVHPFNNDDSYIELPDPYKQIVKLCNEYSDQNLFKLFSKNRNPKEFLEKVELVKIEQHIRPYIERRISSIFDIITKSSVKVFMRDKSRSNIFEEDFLNLSDEDAEAVFNFEKVAEGTKYNLEILLKEKKVKLLNHEAILISELPAIIRLGSSILRIREIEGKKIRPFFEREYINVPPASEIRYYKTFILNSIRDFKVNAKGFIIESVSVEMKALLNIESGLSNNAVLVLRFLYGNREIFPNNSNSSFVEFHKKGSEYHFEKITRDNEFEQRIKDTLTGAGFITFDGINYEIEGNRELNSIVQIYNLIEAIGRNIKLLRSSGLIVNQNVTQKKFYLGEHFVRINPQIENDWFDIEAIVSLDGFEIPFNKFRKNILNDIREYNLPNGEIFILPEEWFSKYREVFEFGSSSGDRIRIHQQHFFILEKQQFTGNRSKLNKLDKLRKSSNLPLADIPKSLTTELRPYQQEGYTWLKYLQNNNLGGCLADDMGLGKTVQTIALLLSEKENSTDKIQQKKHNDPQLELFGDQNSNLTSLIVVPASLVYNWKNEIRKFAPSLKVFSHAGIQRNKNSLKFNNYDVIVSSYHTVRQDVEIFSGFQFHYIILDESQLIKNPSSKLYKAVELLNSKFKLVLTGTPIENSIIDLWAQMNFVNPGLLGSLSFFKKEFTIPIEKKKSTDKEDKLKLLINPFILRRKKEEVAIDLPPLSEQVIYCSMTEDQRKIYDSEKSLVRNSIFEKIENDGIEKSSMIVLQGLTKLRQIANHPSLTEDDYTSDSGKFNEVTRNIDNIIEEDHKVLIFSSFVRHLELVEKYLLTKKIRYSLLTGESTNREMIVRSFQEEAHIKVFLISLKAGGVGLNLTSADYVFILDPWWNPASEIQALSRSHRIGQDKNVFVYRFISENSIEEKIQKLQERKSKLADTFVHSNNPMKEINRKDIEDLLS